MPTRLLTAVTACAVVLLLAVGAEVMVRAELDGRLDQAAAGDLDLRFTGPSALLALVTRHASVTATVPPAQVEDLLATRLAAETGLAVTGVRMGAGALGLDVGLGARDLPATVWIGLDATDGNLVATVLSIEAAGLQIPPDIVLDDRTSLTLEDPLAARCPGTALAAVAIAPDGLRLTFDATPDTLDCRPLEDS
ncbi:hypothetical protein [Demequina gelatinilytica]|uniref:hypothetical protein n=1 Tax=Demequina gelatinilytica TaxID=1638980 RepID=UPI000B2723B3|nr:hypothetical protein [Demequina gelatinilytica]